MLRRPWRLVDLVLATVLSLAVLVVHPVQYMLRAPYFVDELWVVLSTRVSFTDLPLVTCVTPIGFNVLLRLVPGTAEERYRLIVLVLAAGAVVVAYLLGLELQLKSARLQRLHAAVGGGRGRPSGASQPLMRRVTAVAVAGAVLLAPMFSRLMILKPYVGDALVTLVLLLLLARLESQWSRSRLAAITLVGCLGMLLSHPSVFVSAAVIGSLVVATTVRREWRRLAEVAVAGAICTAGIAVVFFLFVSRHQNDSLAKWWSRYFLPTDKGLSGALHFLDRRSARIVPFLGTRHLLIVVVMVAVGTATLIALDRLALAVTTPLVVFIAMLASAARKYPFLDLRTSVFWLVAIVVLMAIGSAEIVALLARVHRLLGVVALVAIAAVWVHQTAPFVGLHLIPEEPLGAQVHYLNAHRRPHDIVVVSFSAAWGFAFYQRLTPFAVVGLSHPPVGAPDFLPTFTQDRDIVVAHSLEKSDVRAAVDAGRRLMRQRRSTRMWIVLSHTEKHEQRIWRAALAEAQVEPRTHSEGPWRVESTA